MDFQPIGHIESGYKFKNGTPRQPTICNAARARLTINNPTYSNPDQSIEGLENFSHVWVIFVFHKNNNAYKKPKVKPPRLNGAKVGVFSTRSPYRLNNIGLTLAKIESIEGATIMLSGVDMLDGTPVLDIKPYIPLYDKPQTLPTASASHPSPDSFSPETTERDQEESVSQLEPSPQDNLILGACGGDIEKLDHQDVSLDSPGKKCDLLPDTERLQASDFAPECSIERAKCSSRDQVNWAPTNTSSSTHPNHHQETPSDRAEQSNTNRNNNHSDPEAAADGDQVAALSVAKVGDQVVEHEAESANQVEYADWIKAPPYEKLTVRWTPTAETQLQQFSKDARDDRYRLDFVQSTDEAKKVIHDTLHADPRSSYRRKKCVDRLYFFMVDVLHVTVWFNDDDSVAEVVRVKANREKMLQKLAGFR